MRNESKADPSTCVELQMHADQLAFAPSANDEAGQSLRGSLANIRKDLARYGVTERGIENTINLVEDLIMPILRTLPESTELTVSGAELELVFHLLPAAGGSAVPLESVECLYNELVRYAAGLPMAWRQTASPDAAALGLVVLREVMQHGGFRSVVLGHSIDPSRFGSWLSC